jgi:Lamin Tail Domain
MKQLLNLILVCAFFSLHAQITENFSDGNFTSNPHWIGDDSLFLVNTNLQLQSNATKGTSKDIYLSTSSNFIDSAEWQCWVNFNLSPSTQNFCRFYLVSDQPNLKGNLNGYFIQFGGVTGNTDSITLYKQKGIVLNRIIGGRPSTVSKTNNIIRIKVLRDKIGNWQLLSDTLGGMHFVIEGLGTDNEFTTSNYLGFFARFTTSNITNFYLDDLYAGPKLIDLTPPRIDSVLILNSTDLLVKFSEELDSISSPQLSNFTVDKGIDLPINVFFENGNDSSLILHFLKSFKNNMEYTLNVQGVKDLNENSIEPNSTKHFYPFLPDTANIFDIVIDEILAKPSPSIGLPSFEFIELYNKSAKIISLKDWTIEDPFDKGKFPEILLFPDSFLIITSSNGKSILSNYGTTIGISNFPSLNDDGDSIVLKNAKGQMIHAINYSSDWYNDNVKKNGGWTLEMMDTKNPCTGKNNWGASKNMKGGTPSQRNSIMAINRDNNAPQLINAYVIDNKNIKLTFNEALDSSSISNTLVTINPFGISSSIKFIPNYYSSFHAQFSDSFQTKKIYRVVVSGVKDCAQNSIAENDFADFGIPENIDSGDLIINEILFNPQSGGVDFVEIYNRSDKVVDLKNMFIANTNADNSINDFYQISSNGFILFPKSYCAISENSEVLKQQYFSPNPKCFIECSMPSFPDNSGTAVIIDKYGIRFDQVYYDDKMHFPFLDNKTGVSLERIDFNRPTSDRTNWTSASSKLNATPAFRNSQYASGNANGEHLKVDPEVFSPDGDGYKAGNLFLYDSKGIMVKQLMRNSILGTDGITSWNGLTDKNEKAPIGIYIVYFEVFNLHGEVTNYKNTVVVGGKM